MSGIKFSNTTPTAPSGQALVTFQADGNGDISAAYTPGGGGVDEQTVSYTIVSGDFGKIVVMKGTNLTATLPATPPSSKWFVWIANIDPGLSNVTVNRNGKNIDDVAANITLLAGQAVYISTDGSNYYTGRGTVPIVTTTQPGLVPTLPGIATEFLNGTGAWSTPSGGGGGSPAAQTVTTTSQSYTPGQSVTFALTMAKTFACMLVAEATNQQFRLQLYETAAQRTADASRAFTIPLQLGSQHGCILDLYVVQSGGITTPFKMSPPIIGSNNDSTRVTTIYATVTNIATTTQTIAVTITFVPMES